ncbi:MAG: hypothetical protein U1E27_12450 [Kiritimatiellia bacterium]|nr:hypothetical protein [Kiritimatiellia bacterium]
MPEIPLPQRLYGKIVETLTVLSAVMAMFTPVWILARPGEPANGPNRFFSLILQGEPQQEIWRKSGVIFPAGLSGFWNPLSRSGGSWAAILLICSAVLCAMIPTAIVCFRLRDRLYGTVCLLVSLLTALALSGWLLR